MAGTRPATAAPATSLLLDLPEPCLLAVLQHTADDPAALFSAARAHSRLHQAAVLALSRVAVTNRTQKQVDRFVMYLDTYGQHVTSISLAGVAGDQTAYLRRLPNNMHSLQLSNLRLRLQPTQIFLSIFPGMLGSPLTQLRLSGCGVLDGPGGLKEVLALLPGLQHLSVCHTFFSSTKRQHIRCPSTAIEQLQQLTHLELGGIFLQGPARTPSPAVGLLNLQRLTRLVDLRLLQQYGRLAEMQGDWLSGCSDLTRLVLDGYCASLHPGVLAGRTQLQHLEARVDRISGGSAGVAQLLAELQTLQQLTRLRLSTDLQPPNAGNPPAAAAFAALTASSRLQHLDINECTLPAGVWRHMFPAGRQLPHLTLLDVAGVREPNRGYAAAPAGNLLLSCCPGLQSLDMWSLLNSTEQLLHLQGLCSLSALGVSMDWSTPGALEAVAQLTGLRKLSLHGPGHTSDPADEGLLLQLTSLKHLTYLQYEGVVNDQPQRLVWQADFAEGEPVWHQVHLYPRLSEEAQLLIAALAQWQQPGVLGGGGVHALLGGVIAL